MHESSFSRDLKQHSNVPNRCGLFSVWSEGRVIRRGRPLSVPARVAAVFNFLRAGNALFDGSGQNLLVAASLVDCFLPQRARCCCDGADGRGISSSPRRGRHHLDSRKRRLCAPFWKWLTRSDLEFPRACLDIFRRNLLRNFRIPPGLALKRKRGLLLARSTILWVWSRLSAWLARDGREFCDHRFRRSATRVVPICPALCFRCRYAGQVSYEPVEE